MVKLLAMNLSTLESQVQISLNVDLFELLIILFLDTTDIIIVIHKEWCTAVEGEFPI